MKRWGWIAAVVLVLFGVGFAWFWSLAALPEEEQSYITLRVERGPVTVQLPAEAALHEATSGMRLEPGTKVKTGEGARATIIFFQQAESRLDANSEITITEASKDAADPTSLAVRVELGAGRMWSRVLRLFDLDGSFEVRTPSVVATVRGTAFDLRANVDKTSEVWVSEGAVTVAPLNADAAASIRAFEFSEGEFRVATGTPALAAGESSGFGADGKPIWRRPISVEDRSVRWFTDNIAADELFIRGEQERRRRELERMNGVKPDKVGAGLTRLSERVHLAVAGDQKERLAERYLVRRVAHLVDLAETGKTGLASQEFARIENDVRSRLSDSEGAGERRRIRAALADISLLVEGTAPGSSLYPFKQRFEDLAVTLHEQDGQQADALYARLMAMQARLDEATHFLEEDRPTEAQTALDAARDGIRNVRRDAVIALTDLEDGRKSSLLGKMLALTVRETTERQRLGLALQPVAEVTTTSTEVLTEVEVTIPKPTTPTPPTLPAETQAQVYNALQVYIQPNPIDPGMTAKITVLAVRVADGKTDDVTARSSIKLVQGVGSLAGGVFTATVGGNVTVEASYKDAGKTLTARGMLTVSSLAILGTVEAAANKISIYSGENTSLSAMAHYTNGYYKDVTGQILWKNLTPNLGSVVGNTFTAGAQAVGSAELQATYTEGGVTKTGTVYINITAPPPTSPNYPGRTI